MEVLKLNQQLFKFLGYLRPHLFGKWFSPTIAVISLTSFAFVLWYGTFAFVLDHMDDLSQATECFFALIAETTAMIANVSTAARIGLISKFFDDFKTIVNESNLWKKAHQKIFD